jgi:hypothetical protein
MIFIDDRYDGSFQVFSSCVTNSNPDLPAVNQGFLLEGEAENSTYLDRKPLVISILLRRDVLRLYNVV